jgi:hypothetical protein
MREIAVIALSCTLAGTAIAQDFSPAPVRNYRPYSALFLRFLPGRQPLPSGSSEWSFNTLAANSLNFVPIRVVGALAEEDIELDRLDVGYSRGIGKGWEVAAHVPIEDLGPGVFDPIIDWYHRTFLRLHSIRALVPYGGHLVYSPAGGPFTGGGGIGDVSLYASKTLGGVSFLSGGLKLPTGNPDDLLGSGNVDAGIAGQTAWRLGRKLGITVNAAVVAQGTATRLRHTRGLVVQGGLALAYAPNKRDSWIVQASYEQAPLVEGIEALDKWEPSTTFAYRRSLSERESLTLYFIEDMNAFSPNFPVGATIGPDPVFGLMWSRRV